MIEQIPWDIPTRSPLVWMQDCEDCWDISIGMFSFETQQLTSNSTLHRTPISLWENQFMGMFVF
jgi:hypothetical protein